MSTRYVQCSIIIRESVDSLCRDGADMPRPPYIGKACTHPNATFVSLFRHLTVVLNNFYIQQPHFRACMILCIQNKPGTFTRQDPSPLLRFPFSRVPYSSSQLPIAACTYIRMYVNVTTSVVHTTCTCAHNSD